MKPWLHLPAKLAHDLSPLGLQLLSTFRDSKSYSWRPYSWRGLNFANPLGIAGGVDKDGARIEDWWCFGPGFIEVGTVTPQAQGPNPGKIIDRDIERKALWNKMGFPNGGVDHLRANLIDLPEQRVTPVFVNIGKNRETPQESAASDYASCIHHLSPLADAFVINISSPNTAGLRDLFQPKHFRPFLGQIFEARDRSASPQVPLLLKLSPDLSNEDLRSIVRESADMGIDGYIATNTTLTRSPGMSFSNEGGVSGQPLASRSKEVLAELLTALGTARQGRLIISVGGVMTPNDVFERLDLGADLVQTYSALIFEGPGFFDQVNKEAQARWPSLLS